MIVETMDFGKALEFLERAKVVRRLVWESDQFIVAQIATRIDPENIDKIKSLPMEARKIINSIGKGIIYKDQILIVNSKGEATNWTPSSTDLFATDWYVVK